MSLPPAEVTRESVRQAAAQAIGDEQFRTNAQRIRNEIASMPLPATLVAVIEELANTATE